MARVEDRANGFWSEFVGFFKTNPSVAVIVRLVVSGTTVYILWEVFLAEPLNLPSKEVSGLGLLLFGYALTGKRLMVAPMVHWEETQNYLYLLGIGIVAKFVQHFIG